MNAQLVGHGFAAITPRPTETGLDADADAGAGGYEYDDRRPLMAGYLPSSRSSSSVMLQGEEAEGRHSADAVRAEAAEVRLAAQEVRAAWLGLGLGLGLGFGLGLRCAPPQRCSRLQ